MTSGETSPAPGNTTSDEATGQTPGTPAIGSKRLDIAVETFNCHGFKESVDYIFYRLLNVDFMVLNETWVKPNELDLIQSVLNDHEISSNNRFVVFNKCQMSHEDIGGPGRPYGGVAIICRVIEGLSYEFIQCDSNRIIAVIVKTHDNVPLHILIGVYMPWNLIWKFSWVDHGINLNVVNYLPT